MIRRQATSMPNKDPIKQSLHHICRSQAASWIKWARYYLPPCFVLTLSCNILGITLPFVAIRQSFLPTKIYSLPHSILLMWQHHLYLICCLVTLFSVIFPFIKLTVIIYTWFIPCAMQRRVRTLQLIERWGKWSYLDIYMVILLLVLTHRQLFVIANTLPGIYYFVIAISMSMLLAQFIVTLCKSISRVAATELIPKKPSKMHGVKLKFGWRKTLCISLLGLAIISWMAALGMPLLRIHQFFLFSRSYSIFQSWIVLIQQRQWLLSCAILLFLALAPAARFFLLLRIYWLPASHRLQNKLRQLARQINRWCMLDIFALGLMLIILEGHYLVKTTILPGLYVVLVDITISYILLWLAGLWRE